MQDFLFELLTEELPPKSLKRFSAHLKNKVTDDLKRLGLHHGEVYAFVTPRRLAIYIHQLAEFQPDQHIERFGPSLSVAFDTSGAPTKAAQGFAVSCGIDIKDIEKKNNRLFAQKTEKGKSVFNLMPAIMSDAIKKLPIPKPMRWGNRDVEFVRPAHNLLMLYGEKIVAAEILELTSNNQTQGHRFLAPNTFKINHPSDYLKQLEEHFVLADFDVRQQKIKKQISALEKKHKCHANVDEDLLDEVTSIVEWPVALFCNFPKQYLNVPTEALISSIQSHQKCFPVMDGQKKLLPHFITISNIESKNKKEVIAGNERVMNDRLADAEFFYHTDLKTKLEDHIPSLKHVLFQKKLGSIYDKSIRIAKLAHLVAETIDFDKSHIERAAMLSKTDLMTNMVGEFPELQGITGKYYAQHEKLPASIAIALDEQYMPRFAGDELPKTPLGQALALADRIDTLVGIFGINQLPTGTKDPFGLRRAALGIIRIIIENNLSLNLNALFNYANDLLLEKISNKNTVNQTLSFIKERLKYWLIDQGFSAGEFSAVNANDSHDLLDFYHRMQAVHAFKKLKASESLSAANKRVNHLLEKQKTFNASPTILFEKLKEPAEIKLATLIEEKIKTTKEKNYEVILKELATLKEPVDDFFDHVMVMVDDTEIKQNRLTLLSKMRDLFLQVADISLT